MTVPMPKNKRKQMVISVSDGSSSEDEEWNEVGGGGGGGEEFTGEEPEEVPLQITLNSNRNRKKAAATRLTKEQRALMLSVHQTSALCWMAHGFHLNSMADDEQLQATLLSLCPPRITNALQTQAPKMAKGHGVMDLFIQMLRDAVAWFSGADGLVQVDIQATECQLDSDGLLSLISSGDLKKISATDFVILFATLLRALGLETRIVVALLPVPFRLGDVKTFNKAMSDSSVATSSSVDSIVSEDSKPSTPSRRTRRVVPNTPSDADDDDGGGTEIKSKLGGKRKASASSARKSVKKVAISMPSHNVWVEVLLRQEQAWVCIDVLRQVIDDPHSVSLKVPSSYIIAFEAVIDRAKDITRRYVSSYSTKTVKMRCEPWWTDTVMKRLQKPSFDAQVDKLENEQLFDAVKNEGVPSTISAFLNHPQYVLERHLKKFEILYPKEDSVGQIRDEKIYKRLQVKTLHTSEKWLSLECRIVKPGEEPVKTVKSRVVPNKKGGIRDLARITNDGDDVDEDREDLGSGGPLSVGLYGEWQTEVYVPAPIINGIIPKNKYNNMDLFLPAMLPSGAKHLIDADILREADIPEPCPFRIPTLKKVCRQMDIDFAEAVVGFDYHGGRSVPRSVGVVVADENAVEVRREFLKQVLKCIDKEQAAREAVVVARWEKFVKKLSIRSRLEKRFGAL